ncbi:MAG: hypothetical protein LUP95_02980 [Euryarchaeota archaeon]|nr:hypothetical protein [Euryarchaeota archaeon]
MYKKLAVLLSLLICSTGIAGCINANNSPPENDKAPVLPQTYNVTGKNFTLLVPKVGQWARYRVIAPNGSESFLTYQITEKTDENFTINVTTAGKNASAKPVTTNTIEARYDSKGGSLIKVSSGRNGGGLSDLFFNSSEVNAHKIALQDVNTTYGNLTCIHSRIGAFDIWVNEEVPVTGIVKCVTGNQYVLLDALNKSGNETATS